jgi:hypothetical protein
MKKDRWNPGDYPYDQQLWTDKDLAKFAMISFVAGIIVGVLF